MRTAILAVVVFGWLCAPSARAQSRVFHDDFESGSLEKWTKDPSRPFGEVSSRAADGGTAHTGGRFLSLDWRGADFTTVWLDRWDYNREFLIRMWWRLDVDVDNRPGAKFMRLGWVNRSPSFSTTFSRDYRAGASRSNGSIIHQSWRNAQSKLIANCWESQDMDDRQWHRVEIYIKHDTNGRDGVIKMWFDGKLGNCYPFEGDTFDGETRWFPLILPSNWSQNVGWVHDSTNHFYVDDVEIFADVGSGAVGRMDDATIRASSDSPPPTGYAPATPTGLRIIGLLLSEITKSRALATR